MATQKLNISFGETLTDPHGICKGDPARLRAAQEKISSTMTRMYQLPDSGGNVFLYAYTSTKPHELVADLPSQGMPFTTAATDGKKYYWNIDFLDGLNADECSTVMEHEGNHVVFFHPDAMKYHDDKKVFNWAIDYVVWSFIETDRLKTKYWTGKSMWGSIGTPLTLRECLSWLDGKTELVKDVKYIFADKSLYGRSSESIYDELMKHKQNSPRKCKKCGALSIDPKTKKPAPPNKPCDNYPGCEHHGACCPVCGALPNPAGGYSTGDGLDSLDMHMPAAVGKQEVLADIMRAKQMAQTMRGNVPSYVDDILGELEKPTLKFTDLVRCAMMRKTQEAGTFNNWKNLRRRYLPRPGGVSAGFKGQYLPTRHTHKPRWLAMLDTSGSMSNDDMAYGITQLQALGNSEGFIVPCDSGIDWTKITPVKKASADNLRKTKVVGRGGTVFDDFFRDYPEKLGTDFDVIIILTDGDCGTIPMKLRPKGIDVVWVITRPVTSYKPSFGRVAPLRNERR